MDPLERAERFSQWAANLDRRIADALSFPVLKEEEREKLQRLQHSVRDYERLYYFSLCPISLGVDSLEVDPEFVVRQLGYAEYEYQRISDTVSRESRRRIKRFEKTRIKHVEFLCDVWERMALGKIGFRPARRSSLLLYHPRRSCTFNGTF